MEPLVEPPPRPLYPYEPGVSAAPSPPPCADKGRASFGRLLEDSGAGDAAKEDDDKGADVDDDMLCAGGGTVKKFALLPSAAVKLTRDKCGVPSTPPVAEPPGPALALGPLPKPFDPFDPSSPLTKSERLGLKLAAGMPRAPLKKAELASSNSPIDIVGVVLLARARPVALCPVLP